MATDTMCIVSQIGEVAGEVWHLLERKGSMSISKLVKEIDGPRTSPCKHSAGSPAKIRSTSKATRRRESFRCIDPIQRRLQTLRSG